MTDTTSETPSYYNRTTQPWDLQRSMEPSGSAFVDARRCDAIKYCFRFKEDMEADLRKAKHCVEAALAEVERLKPSRKEVIMGSPNAGYQGPRQPALHIDHDRTTPARFKRGSELTVELGRKHHRQSHRKKKQTLQEVTLWHGTTKLDQVSVIVRPGHREPIETRASVIKGAAIEHWMKAAKGGDRG